MCGLYAFTLIDKLFECYSITHPVLILDLLWNKDRQRGERIINARSETAANAPLFKQAFLTRRCLIPATGFYEWAKADGRTQPYYIHLTTEPVFSFAGLYDTFTDKDGKEHKVYTILTTRPNRLLAPIHNRMPVILH
jgi:putative SOS response-associated peptidase YedK